MSPEQIGAARTPLQRLARNLRLLRQAAEYEFRKVVAFRTGFFVREVLRGVAAPIVLIFVFRAVYAGADGDELNGRTYDDIVAYMIMLAILRKPLFDERGLDVSEQIFEGYITKYLIMPFRYFVLSLGRWVQYVALQIPICTGLWLLGYFLVPEHWPRPASTAAAIQAVCLVFLGSYCYFLMAFILHALAFWLEVVWTLLVMSFFVTNFAGGCVVPIPIMWDELQLVLSWLFPYWSLFAPIELWNGHMGTPDFLRGLAMLGGWAAGMEALRVFVWKRGSRRYAGGGM